MVKKTLSGELVAEFGLCENRHEYPVKECIFPEVIQRMNFPRLEMTATAVLKPLVDPGIKSIVIYASGCTEAMLAVYSAALRLHVSNFTVMHYDAVYETYVAQQLAAFSNLSVK